MFVLKDVELTAPPCPISFHFCFMFNFAPQIQFSRLLSVFPYRMQTTLFPLTDQPDCDRWTLPSIWGGTSQDVGDVLQKSNPSLHPFIHPSIPSIWRITPRSHATTRSSIYPFIQPWHHVKRVNLGPAHLSSSSPPRRERCNNPFISSSDLWLCSGSPSLD